MYNYLLGMNLNKYLLKHEHVLRDMAKQKNIDIKETINNHIHSILSYDKHFIIPFFGFKDE